MRILTLLLLTLLLVPSLSHAVVTKSATAKVTWDTNTESDISKYTLHIGTSAGTYTNIKDVVHVPGTVVHSGTFNGLLDGTMYYFAVKACDKTNLCSDYSSEVSQLIKLAPDAPDIPRVSITVNITIAP